VLYGEGAVAHAGLIIARGGDPYGPFAPGTFVGANYGPLTYVVVALGAALGPFVGLRVASIAGTLAVAAAVAWRPRGLVGVSLAASYLALFPVEIWGPAHRADPLAVALTAAAVLAAGPSWSRAGAAGVAGVLAILAKPTAAVPLAVVLAYLVWRERRTGVRVLAAGIVAAVIAAVVLAARFDTGGMLEHLVRWNALPFDLGQLAGIVVVGALSVGVTVVAGARTRDPRLRAYLVGATAVVILAAREGSTINYVLDLAAAASLAIGSVARPSDRLVPLALAAQVVLAVALFRPFDASATIGAWGDPRRVALVSDLARTSPHLVEESGILVANGIEPVVDDIFLWSRLVASGAIRDEITPRVRTADFATIVAEVPLDRLEDAPGYERQRWPMDLVRAVLGSYRLEVGIDHHYRYVPRRGFVEVPRPSREEQ